jgi:hypothetical protein
MNKKSLLFLAPLATIFALATAARAETITVPNPDLEANGYVDASDTTGIPDFVESYTGPGHYGDAGVVGPDGMTSGFINTDGSGTITLTTDLTAGGTMAAPTFIAGDTYTLNLEVGINPTNQNAGYDRTGNVTFGLLSAGTAVDTQTMVAAGAITPTMSGGSPQVTFENFTFSYLATAADNGKAIGVQINDQYGDSSQTEFTELQLDAAPEPSTYAMMGLGLLSLLAFGKFRKLTV